MKGGKAGRALIACAGLAMAGWAAGPEASRAAAPVGCEALKALPAAALGDRSAVIASAVAQPAAASAPAHCEVLGKLQERQGANGQTYAIKFHMRLPEAWNGRFFFQGGGGFNGAVGSALGSLLGQQPRNALSLGYAVVSTDSGHDGAANNDPKLQGAAAFGWDAEARRNYGGGAIGPVVRVAKGLIRARYGRAPEFSYYVGGSKGGQEAMMAAERYPEEFDAVLAGYPGFRLAYAGAVGQLWDAQAFAEPARALGRIGPDGLPQINRALSEEDLALVGRTIVAACDGLDQTMDGMVENFPACTTDRVMAALSPVTCPGAKADGCLAPVQVAALRKAFEGARDASGALLYSDWAWDAGVVGANWRDSKIGAYASDRNLGRSAIQGGAAASAIFTSPPTPVADDPTALTRYALDTDVRENARKTRAKWGRFNESAVDFMHADAVDLSPFVRRGGKMLIFHGVSDPTFSIKDTIRWLEQVDAHEGGKAAGFVRLFAVPGMNHGGGGPSTDQIDAFSALVAWREKGEAPASLVGTARPGTPWPGRTRLLCPWPEQPRRVGEDLESAASFRCVRP